MDIFTVTPLLNEKRLPIITIIIIIIIPVLMRNLPNPLNPKNLSHPPNTRFKDSH